VLDLIDQDILYYNHLLDKAKGFLCDRQIEAFSLSVFRQTGYPTEIHTSKSPWIYHDAMQENRWGQYLSFLNHRLTSYEIKALSKISIYCQHFSSHLASPFPFAAINTVMASIYLARIQESVAKIAFPKLNMYTLEIGPGSGKLPIALHELGLSSNYIAIEPTQGFYHYQKALWKNYKTYNLSQHQQDVEFNHVNWFDYCRPEYRDFNFNCVHANHCLNEMTELGLRYHFSKIMDILDSRVGFMISESQVTERIASIAKEYGIYFQQVAIDGSINAFNSRNGVIGFGVNIAALNHPHFTPDQIKLIAESITSKCSSNYTHVSEADIINTDLTLVGPNEQFLQYCRII